MIGRGSAGVRGTPAGRWRRAVVAGLAVVGVACGVADEPSDTATSDLEGSEAVTPDASPSPTEPVTRAPPPPMGTTSPTTPAEDEPDGPGEEATADTGAGSGGASPKPSASPSPSLSPPKDLPATPETDKPHAPG